MRKRQESRIRRAIRIARRYCANPDLHFQDIDESEDLPPGTAAHDFKYARQKGLIVVRDEIPTLAELNTKVGAILGTRFFPAQMVVIETPRASSPRARRRLERQHEADDLLHQALGAAAAEQIARALKNNDILGVGAGRAVFHAARALENFPGAHRKKRGITVIALHGRATRRVWRVTSPYAHQSVDSLRTTLQFASSLPMSIARPVDLPLIHARPEKVAEALEREAWFLSRRVWSERPPSLAVVGVGLMGAPDLLAPRAASAAGADLPRAAPPRSEGIRIVRPIASQLRSLRAICREFFGRHRFIPISDVCDRLFWVPDPEESPDLRAKAWPLIVRVNAHLLTIETGLPPAPAEGQGGQRRARCGSLDHVQEVLVVAGGSHKVRALDRLLRHRRPDGRRFADTLVTDVETAEALLARAGAADSAR